MEVTQETGIEKFKAISDIVAKNRPLIQEKIEKAITALGLIQKIDTDEHDEYANNVLVKCNATLPVVEGLRKEYTSIIDEWKKSEMALESTLKKEMDRVRGLRNERANRKAAEDRAAAEKIELQKRKDIEIARIKSEQVKAVEIGSAKRVADGENAIAKLFDAMTLENIDNETKKLNFTPKLKEEVFRSFLAVSYDNSLVSEQEFKEIVEKAYNHFNYPKCDAVYCEAVGKIVTKWKAQIEPKRAELTKIARASGAEAERLAKEAADKASKAAQERTDSLKAVELATETKASEALANQKMDAEFTSQISLQDIVAQDGTRGIVSYRLKDGLTPLQIVETMSRAMVNVFADPAFRGIHKRDKAGIVKRDDKGNAEYIDGIQIWLDLLAKIKPSPEFEGLIKFNDVSTVAKAK